jgi:uncharacterized membrane protein
MSLFNTNSENRKGETQNRSLIKATTWRILASLDTFTISYFLTGDFKIAASIGGIEIFTKLIVYFLHERFWNNVKWGKRETKDPSHLKIEETKRRSLAKALTWRVLGSLDTITISFVLTGQIKTAITIGTIEIFTKLLIYFLHERAWNYVKWGKREFKQVEIENRRIVKKEYES